jgi:hypothetical protein
LSLVNRIANGLVFQDKFDTDELDARWQVSPSDDSRYSLTEKPGYLRLKHGDPDLFILMNSPRYDFVMEVDTLYVPTRASDQGGVVAFRDKDTRIELLEYYDPATGTTIAYDKLRLIRKADLFEGYGSNDNGKTWDLIGVSYMSAPKVGMVLHGIQEAQSDDLDIDEVRMYRDTTVQVGNLIPGQIVKLVTETGTVIGTETCKENSDHIRIDCTNVSFPLKGNVQVFDTSGFLLDESGLIDDLWGGDVFWYGVKLDLEIDGIQLRQDREYQLGNMENGLIERRLFVVNNNDIPIYNVRISVMALSEYYGWEWADIASDLFGEPGTYQDTILVGTIQPGDRIPIWCKITRRPYQQIASLHDYKFRLMIESG